MVWQLFIYGGMCERGKTKILSSKKLSVMCIFHVGRGHNYLIYQWTWTEFDKKFHTVTFLFISVLISLLKFLSTMYFGTFTKLWYGTFSFVTTVQPSAWNKSLSLDELLWNLIFEYFLKICQGNSSFVKIRQE